jgi:hypothetical protein
VKAHAQHVRHAPAILGIGGTAAAGRTSGSICHMDACAHEDAYDLVTFLAQQVGSGARIYPAAHGEENFARHGISSND